MSYVDFKYIPVTTITLVVTLNAEINRILAFSILPITRINLPEQKRRSKKYKLPPHDVPGCILSMRFNGITRGIIRSNQDSYLKNSISIDISVKDKNINIKLSGHKIHMCGAKSLEQGWETAQYIVDHLVEVQAELDYMNEDDEMKTNTLEWIKNIIKGEPVKKPIYKYEQIVYSKDDQINIKNKKKQQAELLTKLVDIGISTSNSKVYNRSQMTLAELINLEHEPEVEKSKHDNEIVLTRRVLVEELDDHSLVYPETFDEDVDERIAKFLLRQFADYQYYSELIQELEWITNQAELYEEVPRIVKVQKAMVNYNYDLGFDINRGELTRRIHKFGEFSAIYNNMAGHNVTISLPYKEHGDDVCRKKDTKLIKFIVYHSGKVTQSGPSEDLNEEAYNKFIEAIDIIRPHIIKVQTRALYL